MYIITRPAYRKANVLPSRRKLGRIMPGVRFRDAMTDDRKMLIGDIPAGWGWIGEKSLPDGAEQDRPAR